jgi:hypothetical protein
MKVLRIPTQIAESVLSTFGVRVGTEEPHYICTPVGDGVELRRYGPRIAAETTVTADEDRARNIGFRRLAGYIFGANHRDDAIAMTAPVAQSRAAGDAWAIRFFMPSKWTLATLPKPDDDSVTLEAVPEETVAVLRFSGDRSPAAVSERTEELLEILRDKRIDVIGDPVAWFYDPPWTLPFLRRNEIAVPVRDFQADP